MRELRELMRDKRMLISLACTYVMGIVAHGMVVFNNLAWHDSLSNMYGYELGSSYTSGRWAAELLELFCRKLYGTHNYSVPGYNFFISMLFTAVMSYLIVKILDIDNDVFVGMISSIAIVFPVITTLAAYMYTMPFSQLSYLLCVISVFLYFDKPSKIRIVVGTMCAAFAIGIYQAIIPFMLTLILLRLLKNELDEEYPDWKGFLLECLKIALYCVASLILYLIFLKISLAVHDAELTGYQGINTMTSTGIGDYFRRVMDAYKFFVNIPRNNTADVFPFSLRIMHHLICVICTVKIIVILFWRIKEKKYLSFLRILLLILLFPLTYNFIFVMCDYRQTYIYSLMMYSNIFLFVLPVVLDANDFDGIKKRETHDSIIAVVLSLSIMLFVKYDNLCYTKMDFILEELKAYYIELKTRIESADGYNSSMSIMFLGEEKKRDNLFAMEEYQDVALTPYFGSVGDWINNYNWYYFMRMWTGYEPNMCWDQGIINSINAEEMPHYPDNGSIRVVNDVVVVNF